MFRINPTTFFGRCEEKNLAVSVPNPKKSFTGKLLKSTTSNLKILLVGAHFPVGILGKTLEGNDQV